MPGQTAGAQRAGKFARFATDGSNLNVKEASFTWKGDDLDTTNFEDAGIETGTIGVEVVEWDVSGDWDANDNFYSVIGLYPRDDLPNTYGYENVSDNVYWLLPFARVLSAKNTMPVKGLVGFQASGKSNGTFIEPGG